MRQPSTRHSACRAPMRSGPGGRPCWANQRALTGSRDDRGSYLAMAIGMVTVDRSTASAAIWAHVLGTGVLDEGQGAAGRRPAARSDLLGKVRDQDARAPIRHTTRSVITPVRCGRTIRRPPCSAWSARGSPGPRPGSPRPEWPVTVPLNYHCPPSSSRGSRWPASCALPGVVPSAGLVAASAAAIVAGVLGLPSILPGRRVSLRPMSPPPFGPMRVTGLRFRATSFGSRSTPRGETT